jgi:hypothetical protein
MSVSRDQLYQEVWAEPMTTVARRYEISSNYLKRVCDALVIPCPPRGYWAKVAAGQKPGVARLPSAHPGLPATWTKGDTVAGPLPVRKSDGATPETDARPVHHPLLRAVAEIYEGGRTTNTGYLRPNKRVLPDIVVSAPTLPRAIDSLSDLFIYLEAHGCPVRLDNAFGHRPQVLLEGPLRWPGENPDIWRPCRLTVTFVGKLAFGLTLFEASERVEVVSLNGTYVRLTEAMKLPRRRLPDWTTHVYLPTGRLVLRAYAPYGQVTWQKEWREIKPGDLCHRFRTLRRELREAVPTIQATLEEAARAAEAQRQRWIAESLERERRELERRRAEAVRASREELLAIVERWALARRVEDFFGDAEARATRLDDEERNRVMTRLESARELLGGTDALRQFAGWRSPDDREATP